MRAASFAPTARAYLRERVRLDYRRVTPCTWATGACAGFYDVLACSHPSARGVWARVHVEPVKRRPAPVRDCPAPPPVAQAAIWMGEPPGRATAVCPCAREHLRRSP